MDVTDKNRGGRPTKYQEVYCDMLLEHMRQGLSLDSFAGVIGVHRDTVYEWAKKHPRFSDTIRVGVSLSLLFWEKMGMAGMTGKIRGFSAAIYCFNMKNRFGWRDQAPDTAPKERNDALDEALALLDRERPNTGQKRAPAGRPKTKKKAQKKRK